MWDKCKMDSANKRIVSGLLQAGVLLQFSSVVLTLAAWQPNLCVFHICSEDSKGETKQRMVCMALNPARKVSLYNPTCFPKDTVCVFHELNALLSCCSLPFSIDYFMVQLPPVHRMRFQDDIQSTCVSRNRKLAATQAFVTEKQGKIQFVVQMCNPSSCTWARSHHHRHQQVTSHFHAEAIYWRG